MCSYNFTNFMSNQVLHTNITISIATNVEDLAASEIAGHVSRQLSIKTSSIGTC